MINDFIIIVFMLLINAMFAAYEMAIASISRARIVALSNLKCKGSTEALFMKDRMEGSLAVVQLGITFAGAVAAAVGGVGIADDLESYLAIQRSIPFFWAHFLSILFLVIPLSIITIIFAELIPKMMALNHRETICLRLSPFMKNVFTVFYPFISFVEGFVKRVIKLIDRNIGADRSGFDHTGIHELNAAISLARTSRLISASEEKILTAASQLSRKTVGSIITPLNDISMIADSNSLTDALIQAHSDMHTRFPVYDSQMEQEKKILGYVNFKDIVAALKLNPHNPTIKGIIRPIPFFNGDLVVASVLESLIKDNAHLAMILGKDNLPIGMITLEDIIEELVGDIEDEYDRQPNYIHSYDAGWIMGGGVTMATLAEKTGIADKRPDFAGSSMRLSEWCEKKIGRIKGGEIITDNGLSVVVRKLRRHKVGEAVVSVEASV